MFKSSKPQSLETYMAQIERELRDLPAPARAEEMREIESHLRAMIEQRGDVAATLAQFGAPRKVGRGLRRAWERKQPEAWWRALVAPLAGMGVYAVLSLAMTAAVNVLSPAQFGAIVDSGGGAALVFGIYLLLSAGVFLSGFVMGSISPKRSLLISLLLVAVFSTISIWPTGVSGIGYGNMMRGLLPVFIGGLVATTVGIYFGARFSRKRAARIADAQ